MNHCYFLHLHHHYIDQQYSIKRDSKKNKKNRFSFEAIIFFTIAYGDEDSIDCDDVGEDVSTGRAVVDERPI